MTFLCDFWIYIYPHTQDSCELKVYLQKILTITETIRVVSVYRIFALGWVDGSSSKVFAVHTRGPEFSSPAPHSSVTMVLNNGEVYCEFKDSLGYVEIPQAKSFFSKASELFFFFQPHLLALPLLYKWQSDWLFLPHVASTVYHGNLDSYELSCMEKAVTAIPRVPAKFHPE